MALNPYLNFDGDCRQAFDFYREVFGGEFSVFQTFGDGPEGMPLDEADRDKVMHVSLPIRDSVLMGSDVPSGDQQAAFRLGSSVQISFAPASREETERCYQALSEGGTVLMPLADQFWGAYFGSCIDRFGIHWMLDFGPTEES